MKQLKFMLAAATAIGLATAAQADVNTYLVGTGADAKENFNDAELGAAATSLTGYSYAGATAADNESVVVTNGYNGTQSLQVNTGTDPIVRDLNYDARTDIDMTAEGFKSLTIDTMVQFTVTPHGDTVTPGVDDKLMIYLKEDLSDAENPVTNLVVRAAGLILDQDGVATTEFEENGREYVIEGYEIDPTQWYRLQVKARAVAMDEEGGSWPVFQVFIGEELLTLAGSGFDDENLGLECDAEFSYEFVSLQIKDVGLFYTSGADEVKLRYVGFAGEGMVDDLLVFRTDEGETSVDFTLALGTGVSAVSWTVNGEQQDTAGGTFTADSGTTLTVAINSVTYAAGYAGTQDWTGWGTNVAESTTIPIEATKFADVTTDGETTQITPTATTIADAANGAFECPASDDASYADAVAKLGKAVTWATSVAKKSYNDAMSFINDMDFDSVTTNNVNEAAYLFNCAPTPEAVATEAAAFTFPSFTKDMTLDAMKAAIEEGKSYNGTVQIHGATTLENGGEWANGKSGFFYKAVLVK